MVRFGTEQRQNNILFQNRDNIPGVGQYSYRSQFSHYYCQIVKGGPQISIAGKTDYQVVDGRIFYQSRRFITPSSQQYNVVNLNKIHNPIAEQKSKGKEEKQQNKQNEQINKSDLQNIFNQDTEVFL